MAKKVMEDMEEAYSAQDKMLDDICTLLKRVDELQKRCEELEKRESIHNAIDGALNVQKQLDEHSKKIHNIGSYLEPIHNKLDKINERLDAHDEKFSDINVRLCNANEKSDKLKARLNMIFGAGGGLHLATYGMMVEKNEKPTEEDTEKAAKVIKDYCHGARSCFECPFYNKKPSGYEGCEFLRIAPCGWHVEE